MHHTCFTTGPDQTRLLSLASLIIVIIIQLALKRLTRCHYHRKVHWLAAWNPEEHARRTHTRGFIYSEAPRGALNSPTDLHRPAVVSFKMASRAACATATAVLVPPRGHARPACSCRSLSAFAKDLQPRWRISKLLQRQNKVHVSAAHQAWYRIGCSKKLWLLGF
jgi:hypothetical protein